MSIRLSTCKKCGSIARAPRYSCGACGEFSTEFVESESKGIGSIYSFTTVYVAADQLEKEAPYTLAIVTLDEGLNVLGRAPKEPSLEIGAKVTLVETKDGIDYFAQV